MRLNVLTGTIPTSIGALKRMVDLNFGTNSLEGTVPTEISGLSKLVTL
jgi:hypothetical protein